MHPFLEQARRVIDIEIDALSVVRDRLDERFCTAVEWMRETVERKNKLIVTGVGKSGHIGEKIAATLTSTGAPCVVLDAVNALHGDMGLVTEGDLILMLSYSGATEELLNLLPSLRRSHVRIISLCGNPEAELARESDLVLDVSVSQEACPLNLAPTSSTTATLAVGDALAMVLLDARGFKKEDFARFHPGGSLGRTLLLKVERIMRPLETVATCRPTDTVSTALARISEKRCGATIITNEDGTLAGIYTHGDFARGFQTNASIGSVPLGEVMTPGPVSVQVDKLAVEVLNLFEKHRIQDLIVLDSDSRPVGLVDAQDLPRFNLI